MPEYPSGTVAFLFTDIEGSTKRWERDSRRRWGPRSSATSRSSARRSRRRTVSSSRPSATRSRRPSRRCRRPSPPPSTPRSRCDARTGGISVRCACGWRFTPARPRPTTATTWPPRSIACRACSATGYGEQILLTETARTPGRRPLPVGYALQDLGRHRLRDLLEAERIFQLCGPGLPAEFPPLKSLDQQPNNFPAQPTALIGREAELATPARDAGRSRNARLITLTGPGGTGKTRLALQAAAESLDAFPDGVWLVPLATVSDPGTGSRGHRHGARRAPGSRRASPGEADRASAIPPHAARARQPGAGGRRRAA